MPEAGLCVLEKNETCSHTRRKQDAEDMSGQTGRLSDAATSPTELSRVKANHQVARVPYRRQ